jgi:hypothetical protein
MFAYKNDEKRIYRINQLNNDEKGSMIAALE